ncbi:MAG TPA: hypothetical protein VF266_14765 [Thermoanaerobaculia bacterium]
MSRLAIVLPLTVVALAAALLLVAVVEPFVDVPLKTVLGVLAMLLGVLIIAMAAMRARGGAS